MIHTQASAEDQLTAHFTWPGDGRGEWLESETEGERRRRKGAWSLDQWFIN